MTTESKYDMKTKLDRISYLSKTYPDIEFTAIMHHVNEEMLNICFKEMDGNRACGTDGISKEEYSMDVCLGFAPC